MQFDCVEQVTGDSLEKNGVAITEKRRWGAAKAIVVVAGATLGAIAAANAVIAMRTPPLNAALSGTFKRYPARHGDMAYTVSGAGSPVLLLHSLNGGNSMAEWARNFDALAAHHTVYALDFLGWGLSDKALPLYQAEDLIEQVQYFVEDVIGDTTAVIASGQSCGIALKAAERSPQWFSKVVLVCPEGTSGSSEALFLQHEVAHKALRLPIIGTALYNLQMSRRSIENFAKRYLFFDKSQVDERVIARYHVEAHQSGAQGTVNSGLSGTLDMDWRGAWAKLQVPALIVWGRNAFPNGLETAPEWLAIKPDARLEVFDNAMLLPHVEHAQKFNQQVSQWLDA